MTGLTKMSPVGIMTPTFSALKAREAPLHMDRKSLSNSSLEMKTVVAKLSQLQEWC